MSLVAAIFHHARAQPDFPALVKGALTITYGELAALVARTARRLQEIGVRPSDRVGLCLKDSWEQVVAQLAVGHLGAIVVSLDWHARPAEKTRIVDGLALNLVLVEPDSVFPAQCPLVAVDDAWHAAVAVGAGLADPHSDWNAPYVISSTSGTSGTPKFILMTHLQEYFSLVTLLEPVALPMRSRYLSTSPLYFGAGRRGCHAHLLRGDTVIMHPTMFSAAEYADVVVRQRANVGFTVPTIVRQLMQLPPESREKIAGMDALICAGAPLFAEEKRAIIATLTPRFYDRYGTAATGGIATLRPADFAARAESVGQAHMFMNLEIVDDGDRRLAPGDVGRLRLRGPALGTGFAGPKGWSSADEGFRDGWYYPGEIAAFDDQGFLYIRGRTSDVIIRGGAKIYPGEIEAVLQDHDAVVEAAVFGFPQPDGEEAVVAYVVAEQSVDMDALRTLCHKRLTGYRVPREFHVIDRLPRTTSGKVDKAALGRIHAAKSNERKT